MPQSAKRTDRMILRVMFPGRLPAFKASSKRRLFETIAAWGVTLCPGTVLAQVGEGTSIVIAPQLNRSDVAGARLEPDYQQPPIRIGSFALQPALSIAGGFSGNVFNRKEGVSDIMVLISPALRVNVETPPYALNLSASGTARRFAKFKGENSEEFETAAEARLNPAAETTFTAKADYAHLIEPRSSAGTIADASEPVSYRRIESSLALDWAFGKFRLVPSAGYQQLHYNPLARESGPDVDQSFRDTRTIRAEVQLNYDFTGLVSSFISATVSDSDSTAGPDDLRRNSQSTSAVVGLKGSVTPLLSAQIGIGYQRRDYALQIYRDFAGITFLADVQWYVTPLTTLRFQANRTFQNSGEREVAGILNDTLIASAYFDPLRNLRLSLSATSERGSYRDVDTRTARRTLRLGGQYRLNPMLSLGAYVSVVDQDVEGTPLVSGFKSISAGIGVTITP